MSVEALIKNKYATPFIQRHSNAEQTGFLSLGFPHCIKLHKTAIGLDKASLTAQE